MKIESLPTNYEIPEKLTVGSNVLERVTSILSINGFTPILIGSGTLPRIWIYVPSNKEGTEWYPLVKDNFATNPDVQVAEKKNRTIVSTPTGVIVDVAKDSHSSLTVKSLDLRPLGLAVYADQKKLVVMSHTLSSNKFKNVRVMVSIGEDA